jgi:hypothetical protein
MLSQARHHLWEALEAGEGHLEVRKDSLAVRSDKAIIRRRIDKESRQRLL